MSRINDIGELCDGKGEVLLKMWNVYVEPGKRGKRIHNHTRFEVSLVTSGSAWYDTPSGVFEIKQGDVFVFASNEYHCITDVGEDALEIINLHFEPRYLIGSLSDKNMNFCFSHSESFQNRIDSVSASPLAKIIRDMASELLQKQSEYLLYIKSQLNMLVVLLIREYSYANENSSLTQPGIIKALDFIGAHFTDHITLEEIASVAGISPTYFSALFKRFCNVTLWEYVTAKRIEKAARMLVSCDLNMLDIALSCGYNNTANFNKAFKKYTGMTPSQYKNGDEANIH